MRPVSEEVKAHQAYLLEEAQAIADGAVILLSCLVPAAGMALVALLG